MTEREDVEIKTGWGKTIKVSQRHTNPLMEVHNTGDRTSGYSVARLGFGDALVVGKALVEASEAGHVVVGDLPEVEERFDRFDVDGVLDRPTNVSVKELDEEILALIAIKAQVFKAREAETALQEKRYAVLSRLNAGSSWSLAPESLKKAVDKIIELDEQVESLKAGNE